MNLSLTYLMDEICAGVEIYYTGRSGGQYLKTAFILCDDYSELVTKLFLITDNPQWTDKKSDNKFKNYHDVMRDVKAIVAAKKTNFLQKVDVIHGAMISRHKRRNDFFHSAGLLDLSVTSRNCVEAFIDLLEYGGVLFEQDWNTALETCRNLATLQIMLQLDKLAFSDPAITPKVNKILQEWPRNTHSNKKKGAHMAEYPEDLHFRLCISCGGKTLQDKLKALMVP